MKEKESLNLKADSVPTGLIFKVGVILGKYEFMNNFQKTNACFPFR